MKSLLIRLTSVLALCLCCFMPMANATGPGGGGDSQGGDLGVMIITCGQHGGKCWKKELDFQGGFPFFCCYFDGSPLVECTGRECD